VGGAREEGWRAVRESKVALLMSLALLVGVCALTLTRSPPRVVRATPTEQEEVASTATGAAACQSNEVLPGNVSAIRLGLDATFGSRLRVKVYSGSRVITEGSRAADWTGGTVTVPVKPVGRTVSPVKLCVDIGPNSEIVRIIGFDTPARDAAVSPRGQPLSGRMGVEYLAAGSGSWWSRVLAVARHIGIGHFVNGTWVALLIAGLMAAVGVLALRVVWKEFP
jgi:hypothetical protein